MNPKEYWDLTFREAFLYCKMNLIKDNDTLKTRINLYDALANKLLQADVLLNKKPKVVHIRDMFKGLFKKNE